MKKININLKKEIELYEEDEDIKKVALEIIDMANNNRPDKAIEINIERNITNLVNK